MNETTTTIEDTSIPPQDWGYPEALVLMAGLTLGFMAFQMVCPAQFGTMGAPAAFAITFIPLIITFLLGAFYPTHPVVRFLAGIPFTITSLSFLSAGALGGTLILQNPSPEEATRLGSALPVLQRLGLTDVFHSYWFAALALAVLACLMVAAGRRAWIPGFKNTVFLTTHLGTALVLAGGMLGNMTSLSGTLTLLEGQSSGTIILERGGTLELPTPVALRSFHIEPFPLEANLASVEGEAIHPQKGGKALPDLTPGARFELQGWQVTCEAAIPSAQASMGGIEEDLNGPFLALDLEVGSPRASQSLRLMDHLGPLPLQDGGEAGLVQVSPGEVQPVLPRLLAFLQQRTMPGVHFLTDGRETVTVIRDREGAVSTRTGESALNSLALTGVKLKPARLYRVRTSGGWEPLAGLRPQPVGAAKVIAEKNGLRREGWIATGPGTFEYLPLEGNTVLMMMEPSPKTFRSEVQVDGVSRSIRVNDPLMLHGWQLSQSSYQASPNGLTYSILGAKKDPSIPVVWTGLALLLVGTLGALWLLPSLLNEGGAQ